MIPLDPLQTPAVVLGMAGAVLVAGRGARARRCGFGMWVTGNVYVMVMFGFYWVTAIVGVVNQIGERRHKRICDL